MKIYPLLVTPTIFTWSQPRKKPTPHTAAITTEATSSNLIHPRGDNFFFVTIHPPTIVPVHVLTTFSPPKCAIVKNRDVTRL